MIACHESTRLNKYLNRKVKITFTDGSSLTGTLTKTSYRYRLEKCYDDGGGVEFYKGCVSIIEVLHE